MVIVAIVGKYSKQITFFHRVKYERVISLDGTAIYKVFIKRLIDFRFVSLILC